MQRNASLDLLKILLSLMVVAVHSEFLKEYSFDVSYILTQSIFRMAVPIFFIINGYYFYKFIILGKPILLWIKRLFLLYLFWILVYTYFFFPENKNVFMTFAYLSWNYIIGYYHLWYIPASIGAGIILYLIKDIKDMYKVILLFIMYIIGLLLQYFGNYHIFIGTKIDSLLNYTFIYRNFLFFGFPMFLFGYLIAKYQLDQKYTLKFIVTSAVIGILLLFTEGILNLYYCDNLENFDLLFFMLIVAPSLFILVLKSKWTTKSKRMSEISTIIYFIHPLFLTLADYINIKDGILIFLFVIVLSVLSAILFIFLNTKLKTHNLYVRKGVK